MSGRHGYIVLQISVERKTGGHVASTGSSSMSAPIFQLDERQVACKTLWTVLPCLLEWRLSVWHLGLVSSFFVFLVTVCNARVFVWRSVWVEHPDIQECLFLASSPAITCFRLCTYYAVFRVYTCTTLLFPCLLLKGGNWIIWLQLNNSWTVYSLLSLIWLQQSCKQ